MDPGKRERIQREIHGIAEELVAIAGRLAALAAAIPEPDEVVLEGWAPWTLEAELKGGLEIVRHDDVVPAAEALAKLALATPESVRREWERRHSGPEETH